MKINILALVYLKINFPAKLMLKINNPSLQNFASPPPPSESNGRPLTIRLKQLQNHFAVLHLILCKSYIQTDKYI